MRRAAELLDGVVLAPGALFSWHAEVGPPLRARGFARGPELHADRLAVGTGGGACQVANLVFWLALHAGLDIVERHRHGLDLFPDSQRTVPFGCGATVFHPTRDLKLSNPHPWAVRLSLTTTADDLVGAVQLAAPVSPTWRVVEAWHRFVRRADGIWRENQLDRERHDPPRPVVREIVAVNRARVRYPVAPELLQPESPEVA